MSTSRLAVDIGNSKVAAGLVECGAVVDRFQSDLPAERHAAREGASVLARIYDWCADQVALAGPGGIEGVGVSCVVPALRDIWIHLWGGKTVTKDLACTMVDAATRFPFDVAVEYPRTVGADRYCNVAAAMARGHASAVIVDLGTANTYDVLENGIFWGGLIAPGCASAHRALIDRGAQLPEVPFAAPERLVGRHTVEAMQSGSYHQAVGGVRHVVSALRQAHPQGPLLVTGGLALLLAPEIGDEPVYCPDLTLEGAAFLGHPASRP
jgi:type III pantothenate kinase